jgi:hypothetical protein
MGVLVLNLDQSIAFADPRSLPANSNGAASAAHPTSEPSSIGLAESAILVLGMPRSGTTWLAKILIRQKSPGPRYRLAIFGQQGARSEPVSGTSEIQASPPLPSQICK